MQHMNGTASLNRVFVDETVHVEEYVDEYFRQGTKRSRNSETPKLVENLLVGDGDGDARSLQEARATIYCDPQVAAHRTTRTTI